MGIRKSYGGAVSATTLNGAISGAATSIVVTNGTTYPDGSAGKFVIAIDRGLATEEKVLITSRAGNTLTVSNRGYDGTAAQAHADLAVVEHVLDAVTVDEANRLSSLLTVKGDLYVRDATDVQRLAVGANDRRLVADSAQTTGLRWAPDTEYKLVAAKGDLLVGTANDTVAVLPVGANNTTLVADSAQATGQKWLKVADPVSGVLLPWNVTVTQGVAVTVSQFHGTHSRIGRRIIAQCRVQLTTSGTAGQLITIGLPVAAISTAQDGAVVGCGYFEDATGNYYPCFVKMSNPGTAVYLTACTTTATEAVSRLGSGTGFSGALATGDIISVTVEYEAAAD